MKNGIDLHLHLDGSLSPAFLLREADRQGVELPAYEEAELSKHLRAPRDCRDLNDYLRRFALPCALLQTEESLTRAVADLCGRLLAQGLLYAEIRFAPQLHLQRGMTQEAAVTAALQGLPQDGGFRAGLILCCMRMDGNEAQNLETVRLAGKYLGQGVCAADLAGAEALYPTSSFANVFAKAKALGVPFTIHAGEADGPESIWTALKFGAARIGHGVRCLEDPDLTACLRERQIPLEICPTSNLQTRAVTGEYPLRRLLAEGLAVTLNTDNLTVSDTTLAREFRLAKERFGCSEWELRMLKEHARAAVFDPAALKSAETEVILHKEGQSR